MKREMRAITLGKGAAFSMLVLCSTLLSSPQTASAEIRFTAGIEINSPSDFYGPLSYDGGWMDVRPYGRCWRPRVEAGWRPYTAGHWEWTDVGWYWASDEPWAWACYHYGSWTFDPNYGWLWIPGTEWAPAWVTWRESDDYIGWAPCGPRETVLPASLFVFVNVGHFREHLRPDRFIVDNRTIINRTVVVNNFYRETRVIDGTQQRVVVNRGPRMEIVQRASRAPLAPVPITRVARETPIPATVRHAQWRDRVISEPSRRVTQEPSRGGREQFRTERQSEPQPQSQSQQPTVVAPRQQAPVVTTPRQAAPVVTPQQPEVVNRPQREQGSQRERERLQSDRPVQTTPVAPQKQAPVVITPPPQNERERSQSARPPQVAPVAPQQPPVQLPPTATGRERGYPNREQVAPPAPNQVAPREQPPRREVVPQPRGQSERQGPPPERERGRDKDKEKDRD